MADREKFIQCDCYGEGMLVTKFDDGEEMYFSYWRQGIDPIKSSWWMRLKLCWMMLTKGNVYDDQVVLNKEKAMELALWIQEEHDHITEWVREMSKEDVMDNYSTNDPALEHDDWENEGGSNLSNLPKGGCEGGHY